MAGARSHQNPGLKKARWGRARELLSHVGIANPLILHVKSREH